MRRFWTQGRVYPGRHYVVPRSKEIEDFLTRVKEGRYIVLFAPRQTGKTTFFRMALGSLVTESLTYFPIQLNFETCKNLSASDFYEAFCKRVRKEIEQVFFKREHTLPDALTQFLEDVKITNHLSMMEFFDQLSNVLNSHYNNQKVVVIITQVATYKFSFKSRGFPL